MEFKDKMRALAALARMNGIVTALSCMEGATITKRMSLTLEDQLDHVDEALNDFFEEAVNDKEAEEEVTPDDTKAKIGFTEDQTGGTPPHQ